MCKATVVEKAHTNSYASRSYILSNLSGIPLFDTTIKCELIADIGYGVFGDVKMARLSSMSLTVAVKI